MKIYTKTGDKGDTSLFTGQRVPKNDPYIDAIGTVDETNSAIGVALALIPKENKILEELEKELIIIQHALFDVGAALATPRSSASDTKIQKTRFDADETALLEKWIDSKEKELPKLHHFILPGGHPAGAMLHLARSICRRSERLVVPMKQRGDVSDTVMIYLNRLSDYLFVSSRYLNHLLKNPETKWQPHMLNPSQN